MAEFLETSEVRFTSNILLKKELEIKKTNILNCLINSQGNVLLGGEPVALKDVNKEIRRRLSENDKLIISFKAHEKKKYGERPWINEDALRQDSRSINN